MSLLSFEFAAGSFLQVVFSSKVSDASGLGRSFGGGLSALSSVLLLNEVGYGYLVLMSGKSIYFEML
jgi:hypothetical protein